jgi:hypothetical protein
VERDGTGVWGSGLECMSGAELEKCFEAGVGESVICGVHDECSGSRGTVQVTFTLTIAMEEALLHTDWSC